MAHAAFFLCMYEGRYYRPARAKTRIATGFAVLASEVLMFAGARQCALYQIQLAQQALVQGIVQLVVQPHLE